MKKFYALLTGVLLLSFAACEKDPATANTRLGQTVVSGITATTAEVSCPAAFTAQELDAAEVLFLYAAVQNGAVGEEKGFIPNWSLEDGVLSGRLAELEPKTTYIVSVVVSAGKENARSKGVGFVTEDANDPENPIPTFGTPSFSGVTQNAAAVSCSFDYQGDKPISEVYFLYSSASGSEQRAAVTAESGTKSAQLSGLTAATAYTFGLYVVVDGKSFSSQKGTFTTLEAGETAPTFSTPTFSAVTQTTATVSSTFDYTGDKTISEVYFVYSSTTGGEQRAAVTTAVGAKSAQLTGLTAATAYTFGLCAVIDGKSYSGSKSVFTTLQNGGGGGIFHSGWAELPEHIAKPGDYYYSTPYCPDFKVNGRLARNYTVCYSAQMRCAVWVAYPLHECYKEGDAGGRNPSWKYDPGIPSAVQPALTDGSYDQTPKPSYSRGHMIASDDRQVSKATNKQTFYVTNMSPQLQDRFNGSIWAKLEGQCWNNICSDTLFVVTGSHFANTNKTVNDRDGEPCVIPTHFYKVLIRSKSGNTKKPLWELSSDQLQCTGFWFEHKEYSGGTPSQYMTSVADIERQTGLRFFVNVPNAPKATMNKSDWDFR